MDVVASWCFTRCQLFNGRFNFLYCKVGRQVGTGGGCSRKLGDFTRRPACEVSICIWEAIAFAVIGHPKCVVFLPVSLFMICHALRLECVKSTYFTTSVHLAMRTSSSFWSSDVAVVSMSSLVVACWCSRRKWLQLSSQPGM